MIEFTTGNIFTADTDALVNPVNCVGVMGLGLALQFKKAYPTNFKAYQDACTQGDVRPGHMFITERADTPHFIINFPTKRHWQNTSLMVDIDSGLSSLVEEIKRRGILSIAIPPLGSGLGGLSWSAVRPRIEQALADVPEVRVIIFEPVYD